MNTNGAKLLGAWHNQRNHVLTTNYDTIVERIAGQHQYSSRNGNTATLDYEDLYPVPVTNARSRAGGGLFFPNYPETFKLYKLHGSVSWFKSDGETQSEPIHALPIDHLNDPHSEMFVSDKRRFIVPPVYDKSSLLSHESIRSIWRQALDKALKPAENLYIIGYSLPETDSAMHALLWQGSSNENLGYNEKKTLYIIDRDKNVVQRYADRLGCYYDINDAYVGNEDVFDAFVEGYVTGD